MTFREDAIEQFLEIFNSSKEKIRGFEGCEHLELLRDVNDPRVYSTYSYWRSVEDLDRYRDSDLFGKVWPVTKALFDARPVAHSYDQKYISK